MSCECCCPNDCCPEVVAVTLETNSFVLEDMAIAFTPVVVSPSEITMALQIQDTDGNDVAANMKIALWFVNLPTPDAVKSVAVPTSPGVAEWWIVTDANGAFSFTIANTGAVDTWYLNASTGGGVSQSDAITIGV